MKKWDKWKKRILAFVVTGCMLLDSDMAVLAEETQKWFQIYMMNIRQNNYIRSSMRKRLDRCSLSSQQRITMI